MPHPTVAFPKLFSIPIFPSTTISNIYIYPPLFLFSSADLSIYLSYILTMVQPKLPSGFIADSKRVAKVQVKRSSKPSNSSSSSSRPPSSHSIRLGSNEEVQKTFHKLGVIASNAQPIPAGTGRRSASKGGSRRPSSKK